MKYPVTYSSRLAERTFVRMGVEFFCKLLSPLDPGSHPYELLSAVANMTTSSDTELVQLVEQTSRAIRPIRGEKQEIKVWYEQKILILQYIKNNVCFRMRVRPSIGFLRTIIVFAVISDNPETVRQITRKYVGFSEPRMYTTPQDSPTPTPPISTGFTREPLTQNESAQPIQSLTVPSNEDQMMDLLGKVTLADLFKIALSKAATTK